VRKDQDLIGTMIHCFQKQHVGSLCGREPLDGIPEEWREEAGTSTNWQAEEIPTTAKPEQP
jgi:hypothetical protein